MEVIDYLVPVHDPIVLAELEDDLDRRLGARDAAGMVIVPPTDHARDWGQAHSFAVHVGSTNRPSEEVTLDDIVRRAALQKDNRRIHALRTGKVEIFADRRQRERVGAVSVYKCLEVATSIRSHRYFLMEGLWYELDAAHLAAQHAKVAGLFHAKPSLDLPAWDRTAHKDERDYNNWLPTQRQGYLNLDRNFVRTRMHRHGRIEVCDHLAPTERSCW